MTPNPVRTQRIKVAPQSGEQFRKEIQVWEESVQLRRAIFFVTASWVCAGNFEVLADAGIIRPPTPLHAPGTLVKAEFKSNIKTTSDMDLESDSLLPEPVSGKEGAKAKPAIAFKERTKGMAPPPRASQSAPEPQGLLSGARDESMDLEGDLEKDLVITPPPPKCRGKDRASLKGCGQESGTKASSQRKEGREESGAPGQESSASGSWDLCSWSKADSESEARRHSESLVHSCGNLPATLCLFSSSAAHVQYTGLCPQDTQLCQYSLQAIQSGLW